MRSSRVRLPLGRVARHAAARVTSPRCPGLRCEGSRRENVALRLATPLKSYGVVGVRRRIADRHRDCALFKIDPEPAAAVATPSRKRAGDVPSDIGTKLAT